MIEKGELKRAAAGLAAANPSAFPTAQAAYNSLRADLKYLRANSRVMSTSTGGYMLTKDAEGDIELWIMPGFAFKDPAPSSHLPVDELNEQRATGVGMAMAAAIVMRCWGKEVIARQILDSAGLSTLEALKSYCVEQYDIDALLPALDTTEGQP